MDDNRITQHFHFGDIGPAAILFLVALAAGAYVLYRGIESRSAVAYVILGGLVFMTVAGVGVLTTLFIMRQVVKAEERRALVEQGRFENNTRENLALLELQAKAQIAQAKVQEQQWRTTNRELDARYKALPAPESDVIDMGFQPAESLYADFETED